MSLKINTTHKTRKVRGLSTKQVYRYRTKHSQCRGLSNSRCKRKKGCNPTKKGKRKSYCRSKKNRHIHMLYR